MITTQVLKYENHADELAMLATVLELLGSKRVPEAIDILMSHRQHLIDLQQPVLAIYDQREERRA